MSIRGGGAGAVGGECGRGFTGQTSLTFDTLLHGSVATVRLSLHIQDSRQELLQMFDESVGMTGQAVSRAICLYLCRIHKYTMLISKRHINTVKALWSWQSWMARS